MARLHRRSLSNRLVDRLSAEEKDIIYWDWDLRGFGVRVYPSGSQNLHCAMSGPGWIEAGDRRPARRDLGRARAPPGDGDHRPHQWRGRTRDRDRKDKLRPGRRLPGSRNAIFGSMSSCAARPARRKDTVHTIEKHIVPALGELPIADLRREHVADLHYRLRRTPGVANTAVSVLSRMLNRAEAWGLAPTGGNPCRPVAKPRPRRRERFLTEQEFRRLGEALDTLEAERRIPLHAAAALRLLMLTGCRSSEIMTLRWEDVFLATHEIRLPDSKTGPRTVPLSPAAAKVFADLPRPTGNPWVIAGRNPGTRLAHIAYYWYRVRERAGLDDVRIHDLRHSFASRALALGEPLPMMGLLKNPISVRGVCNIRQRSSGSQFGVCGHDGRTAEASRRLETPRWPTEWQEERWRAA